MNILPPMTLAGMTPYSERRAQMNLEMAPRLALGAVDTYVSGLTTVGIPLMSGLDTSGIGLQASVAHSASKVADALPFLNGVMVVGHVALGWYTLANLPYGDGTAHNAAKLRGIGDLITAAGMLGQAVGFGALALPITGLGIAATTAGQIMQTRATQG